MAGMRAARPGAHEYEVKAAIEAVHRGRGAVSWSYPSIVGSGPNATILHYPDGDRQMQAGDLLLVDAACNYAYMSGDITRTYPVSGTFSPAAERSSTGLCCRHRRRASRRPGRAHPCRTSTRRRWRSSRPACCGSGSSPTREANSIGCGTPTAPRTTSASTCTTSAAGPARSSPAWPSPSSPASTFGPGALDAAPPNAREHRVHRSGRTRRTQVRRYRHPDRRLVSAGGRRSPQPVGLRAQDHRSDRSVPPSPAAASNGGR